MLDIKRALDSAKVPERTETRSLLTPWGDAILRAGDAAQILPEHPRPTMIRERYTTLNGMWDYAIVPNGRARTGALNIDEALEVVATAEPPRTWQGRIRVPFSPETVLSGVERRLQPDELLWYRVAAPVPALGEHERLILHFEAVDWVCAVHVNGHLAATHAGGYLPIDIDITPYLAWGAGVHASITVCVYDPSDAGVQPRGKQRLTPGGIWYTAQSGIWQSVWYEVVPQTHLTALALEGDAQGNLTIDAEARADTELAIDVALNLDVEVIGPLG